MYIVYLVIKHTHNDTILLNVYYIYFIVIIYIQIYLQTVVEKKEIFYFIEANIKCEKCHRLRLECKINFVLHFLFL